MTSDAALEQDSAYAWRRLVISLVIATIGGVGLWSSVVVLPYIEADFGLGRGEASFPYTATLIGFAAGGILMGRLADRFGISVPLVIGGIMLALGYILTAFATAYWQFLVGQAVLIGGLGSSVSFGPLVADVSLWFKRRRGIAVALAASGNYLAGVVWSPAIEQATAAFGWRTTHIGIGLICVVLIVPLALMLRRRPAIEDSPVASDAGAFARRINISPNKLQAILMVAGVACCVAMSMPQVHIVAYCGDLGYGPARGAEMLSLMLGLGIVSRLISGLIADKIGGVGTLILGSTLQCLALMLYLPFDGLVSLYVVSALFGLSQGGIVPSYALIVRDYFPAREAGTRVTVVLMTTVLGMALGGWLSGAIYDLTGSYQAAFLNGIAWNLVNMSIAAWLLLSGRRPRSGPATAPA
ncbi:MAG: MFS transporter [Pseudomonadota bacterium]